MMKFLPLIFIVLSFSSYGQLADWKPLMPFKFPTNSSSQIHGQCRISQMKFHATNPAKLYTVTAQGGFFMSNDTGNNWFVSPSTDFMATQFASVAIDPSNDQIIYLGSGDANYYGNGSGVWKSVDGGSTFAQSNTGMGNRLVIEMIIDSSNTQVIVAATNNGIYRTTNAGGTWTLVSAIRQFTDLKQKLSPNSRVLYAATRDSGFFRSLDFGQNWNQITKGIIMPAGITNGNGCRVALSAKDTNAVYFGMVVAGGLLYKSASSGDSFRMINTQGTPYLTNYSMDNSMVGQGNYNFAFWVDQVDTNKIWVQAHNTMFSNDGGATWSQLTFWAFKCHTDMHEIKQSPYNINHLYSMNDGGVWRSTDGGNNWTPKSDGLFAFEVTYRDGKTSPTRRDFINIGTQDNGELYGDSTGWYCIRGGDWYQPSLMDYRPNSTSVYYLNRNTRRIFKNGGVNAFGLPVSFTQTLGVNRKSPSTGFIADSNIYRTYDLQSTVPNWTNIHTLANPRAADAHLSVSDTNRLYIITNKGKVLVTNNAHAAAPVFNEYNLPTNSNNRAFITSIANNADIVFAVANNKVYRSANGGVNWSDVTYNLPNQNHNRILAEEYYGDDELVFIATGAAVYYKKAGQTSWTLYTTNMQIRKNIEDISMYDDSTCRSILRQSSYGRGTWETSFANLRPLKVIFSSNRKNVCNGDSVFFDNCSLGNVTTYNWSFPGGTPSTSTLASPIIKYNDTGKYDVTLIIGDGVKFDTLTKVNNIFNQDVDTPTDLSPIANKNICGGNSTILTVTSGNKIGWYSAQTGGTFLKSGSTFTTPVLSSTTTYYVQDSNNACRSTPRIPITINITPYYNYSKSVTICRNYPYFFKGKFRDTSGTYKDTFLSTGSCDSIETLILTVMDTMFSVVFDTICANQSRLFNGVNINTSGIYRDTILSNASCDSFITLILFVKSTSSATIYDTICSNKFRFFNGFNRTLAGLYKDTLVNAQGCDSFLTLDLYVKSISNKNLFDTICQGDSFYFNSQWRKIAGLYKDTFVNSKGCDSFVNLFLFVKPKTYGFIVATNCFNDPYSFNGMNLNTSGVYFDTLQNANGCDSIVKLTLTIIPSLKVPNFASTYSFCKGDQVPILATTSPNGVVGSWSPNVIDNQSSNAYLFTPNPKECATNLSLKVTINPQPNTTINILANDTICFGDSVKILASGGVNYQWNHSKFYNIIVETPTVNTKYVLTTKNAFNCSKTDTVSIVVQKLDVVIVGPAQSLNKGDQVTLNANSNRPISQYNWLPASYFLNQRTKTVSFYPEHSMLVELNTIDSFGCKSLSTYHVDLVGKDVLIPTGFSPNGDGINDILRPITKPNVKIVSFVIYNRYGEQVYNYDPKSKLGWDGAYSGEKCPIGTYIYQIEYSLDSKSNKVSGNVTLIK